MPTSDDFVKALRGSPESADTPTGASALWMLDRPQIDWGQAMPDLTNQRRSENVEDMRLAPMTLPMAAYKYLGIESSPQEVFRSMLQGMSHPMTRAEPLIKPPGEQAGTPLSMQLGYGNLTNAR